MSSKNEGILISFCVLLLFGGQLLFLLYIKIENEKPYTEISNDDKELNNNVDEEAIDLLKKLVHLKRFNKSKYSSLLRFAGIGSKSELTNRNWTKTANTDIGRTVIHEKERAAVVTNEKYFTKPRAAVATNEKHFTEARASDVTNRKCTLHPGNLHGREKVNTNVHSMVYLELVNSNFQYGGRWRPSNCSALLRVAIIIPYRNREQHLKVLLLNLIPKLQRQLIDFTIYVIEQNAGSSFNRGLMRNVGFLEARNDSAYDCYIFHDVDAIIENDRNLYTCHTGAARHIAAAIDVNKYSLLYQENIAGILSLTGSDFERVNGYSNFFFFWGGEDDNLYNRLIKHGIKVERPPDDIAMVTTLHHEKESEDPKRFTIIQQIKDMGDIDGLKNIHYSNVTVVRKKLFTKISVSVNQTLYEQIFEEPKMLHKSTDNLQNLASLSNKDVSKKRVDVDKKFTITSSVNASAVNSNKNTSQSLNEMTNLEIEMMKNKTGKVWFKMAENIYKSVFDVCEITSFSKATGTIVNKPNFRNETSSSNLTCPSCPSTLRGREKVTPEVLEIPILEKRFNDFDVGGHWAPKWCKASKKLAIIIPYRARRIHLQRLLYNLIPKLQRQLADFTIYVVEQGKESSFNRGLMRNIGFLQAVKDRKYDCYIFNDVDTLIEDDRNIYTCVEDSVYHMASLIDAFSYRLLYTKLIGGILGVTEKVFRSVNGYSNFLFSWGGEDDDLYNRLVNKAFIVTRPEMNVSKSTTFSHSPVDRFVPKKGRLKLLHIRHFSYKDGLNTVRTEMLTVERRKLFTWIHARVDETYYNKMLTHYAIRKNIDIRSGWVESRKSMLEESSDTGKNKRTANQRS